jgi:molybdate transport system substrate-binding protein
VSRKVANITGISSMATREVLAELAKAYGKRSGLVVAFKAVGGVDALRRVQAGEPFDVVVLARDAIDKLLAGGSLVADSVVDLVRSGVVVAVRAGAARPDIGSEDAVRRAVLAARTIGTSTGPSGVALARLFERWGIGAEIRDRIVTPPPGVAVGGLVARGEVELGFQQLSEMARLGGVDILGPLPPEIQIVTTFSAAVAAASRQLELARALLAFMASPAAVGTKRFYGMDPLDAEPIERSVSP